MGESTNERFAVSEVFGRAFEIYRGSLVKLLGLAMVVLLPGYVVEVVLPGLFPLGTLAVTLGSAWLGGAVVGLVLDESNEPTESRSVGELLGSIWPRLWPLFLLNLVLTIAIVIGIGLLIVPGVILGLMWFVAIPAFVVEKLGVFESMSRSTDLTSGSRFGILPIALAILVIEAVLLGLGLLLPFYASQAVGLISSVIAFPIYGIIATVVFLRLRDARELSPDQAG